MAGHEIGFADIIGTLDGCIAKTKMADGNTAGFFGIVLEISLDIFVRIITDDFDGILVGANRSVTAETPELALNCARRSRIRRRFLR